MNATARRGSLGDYVAIILFAIARRGELRRPLLRVQVWRQVRQAGVAALPIVLALALITGAALSTQLSALIGVDAELTQRMIFLGLFFELAPLLSALIVVARSSAGIASELAVMQLHDEFSVLRRLGVPPAEFLLLPRIVGLVIALPAVAVFFQCSAMLSGWLATALIDGRPLAETAGRFLDAANPWLVLASLGKSAVMGAAIGIIACQRGGAGDGTAQGVSDAAIRSVGTSLVAVFVIDVAVASIVWALK